MLGPIVFSSNLNRIQSKRDNVDR